MDIIQKFKLACCLINGILIAYPCFTVSRITQRRLIESELDTFLHPIYLISYGHYVIHRGRSNDSMLAALAWFGILLYMYHFSVCAYYSYPQPQKRSMVMLTIGMISILVSSPLSDSFIVGLSIFYGCGAYIVSLFALPARKEVTLMDFILASVAVVNDLMWLAYFFLMKDPYMLVYGTGIVCDIIWAVWAYRKYKESKSHKD